MTARRVRNGLFTGAALAALALGTPVRAQAPPPAPDTTLHGYLRSLADSTDTYFGRTVAPLDTAGLDSALAWGIANPHAPRRRTRLSLEPSPWFRFQRVDGPMYGARLATGEAETIGRWSGRIGYAAGPNDWLGGGDVRKRFGPVVARARGGYFTEPMNRDHPPGGINLARALFAGTDYSHYLRRQGYEVRLASENDAVRAEVAWRDHKEMPVATTATWTITRARAKLEFNQPAAEGRARELVYGLGLRWPRLNGWSDFEYTTSGDAIGSDFEYRRAGAALGLEVPLGRAASLVPQVEYGRMWGTMTPQSAYYIGGSYSLRSLHRDADGGTGLAIARLDLIWSGDLLETARIPHPAAFPIQASVFGGVGAVWGEHPYGGPTVPGDNWPQEQEWLPEAGAAIMYRPGLPVPDAYLRASYAVRLGPREHEGRWNLSYVRALDLVNPFGE
jgi:hypothetical protein